MKKFKRLEVPTRAVYNIEDCLLLKLMAENKLVEWREKTFTLNSGIESHVYVFGREDLTDNPELEWRTGRKIAQVMEVNSLPTDKQICFIGIPTAGTAFAQAAAMVSFAENIFINGKPICHRIMREIQKKGHGDEKHQKNWVNGKPDLSRHTYVALDNVVTNAASKFKANERLEESGYQIYEMPSLIFVNRQQGGVQKMTKAGLGRIIIVFHLLDITYAFGEMGLWPKKAVRQVEKEIEAHQFI